MMLRDQFQFPWLSVLGLLFLAWLLVGCTKTTYSIKRCVGEGAGRICVEGLAETRRKFESFEFTANFETGEVSLKGSKVSTEFSPLEHAAADVIRQLQLTVPE